MKIKTTTIAAMTVVATIIAFLLAATKIAFAVGAPPLTPGSTILKLTTSQAPVVIPLLKGKKR